MNWRRFPDFGEEVKRPFAVAEPCYDCAVFYAGCQGWHASKEFACAYYQRLPDVMPGTWGQPFPEKVFVPTEPESQAVPKVKEPDHGQRRPRAKTTTATKTRQCECGAPLAKGKRLCDECRAKRRRESKGRYMTAYMRQRRGGSMRAVACSGSGARPT